MALNKTVETLRCPACRRELPPEDYLGASCGFCQYCYQCSTSPEINLPGD